MPGSSAGRRNRREDHPQAPHPFGSLSTLQVAGIFALASAVTLVTTSDMRFARTCSGFHSSGSPRVLSMR